MPRSAVSNNTQLIRLFDSPLLTVLFMLFAHRQGFDAGMLKGSWQQRVLQSQRLLGIGVHGNDANASGETITLGFLAILCPFTQQTP